MRVVRGALATLVLAVVACGGAESLTTTSTGGGGGGGGGGGADPCPGTGTAVSVVDNAFSPSCTKVTVGSTVTWTWNGSAVHNVTFSNSASPNQSSGTYQRAFPAAGTFAYQCTLHAGMNGSIIAQ